MLWKRWLSKSDLYTVFIECGFKMAKSYGLNCMVTMQSWMFLNYFEYLRVKIIKNKSVIALMHMENMVMHIAFGTAVSIFINKHISRYKGTYNQIKIKDIIDDGLERPISFPIKGNRFAQVGLEGFSQIPGSPFAYWVSDVTLDAFKNEPSLKTIAEPRAGLQTGENDTFLRFWYEVSHYKMGFGCSSIEESILSGKKWFPYPTKKKREEVLLTLDYDEIMHLARSCGNVTGGAYYSKFARMAKERENEQS